MLASRQFSKYLSTSLSLALGTAVLMSPRGYTTPADSQVKQAAQESANTSAKEAPAKASKTEPQTEEPASSPDGTKTIEPVATDKAPAAPAAPAAEETASADNEGPKAGSVFENSDELKAETPQEAQNRAVQHWNLARVYMGQFDWDMAQTELDLALMSWPQMQIAHRDLCLVSLMKLNLGRSVAEFMMTVGLGEPIPLTAEEANNLIESGMVQHYKKGLVYCRQQKWKEAAVELEWAANLAPEDCAIQRSLAYAYSNMGDYARAEAHYKKTFELAPHDGASRADLAYFLAENGKMSEAEQALEEAIKSQPKATAYHVDLGWMAEKRGDLDTASRELKTAVTLSPNHANLWQHLGQVLERKGEAAEAKEAFRQALALEPKDTSTQQ